jgi:hypothetical protein
MTMRLIIRAKGNSHEMAVIFAEIIFPSGDSTALGLSLSLPMVPHICEKTGTPGALLRVIM